MSLRGVISVNHNGSQLFIVNLTLRLYLYLYLQLILTFRTHIFCLSSFKSQTLCHICMWCAASFPVGIFCFASWLQPASLSRRLLRLRLCLNYVPPNEAAAAAHALAYYFFFLQCCLPKIGGILRTVAQIFVLGFSQKFCTTEWKVCCN